MSNVVGLRQMETPTLLNVRDWCLLKRGGVLDDNTDDEDESNSFLFRREEVWAVLNAVSADDNDADADADADGSPPVSEGMSDSRIPTRRRILSSCRRIVA